MSSVVDFPGRPIVEEMLTYRWVWKIRTDTQLTIICTFTAPSGRACVPVGPGSTVSPTPDPTQGGGKIAFDSNRDGNDEIYVMNSDGTNLTNLTNNPADDEFPSWSPDGTKIAFESGYDIYVMNADGSDWTRLTNWSPDNPAWGQDPSWSPDGTKIVFTSQLDGSRDIYVMNVTVERKSMLLLKAMYHPNWRATVDGVKTDTVMLMPGFVGVPLTPGKHQVRIEYRPRRLRMILLGLGLLTLPIIWIVEKKGSAIASRFATGASVR